MIKKLVKVLFFSIAILVTLVNIYFIKQSVEMKERDEIAGTKNENLEPQELKTTRQEVEELLASLEEIEATEENYYAYESEDFAAYSLIVNEANASQEFVDELARQINLVPKDILNSFKEKNWTICITNEDLHNKLVKKQNEEMADNMVIEGLLVISDDIIYVYNDNIALESYTVIHEFGHYADKMYGWPSLKNEFKQIYNEEKDSIKTTTSLHSEEELYAEAFKKVILKKDDAEHKVYQYVKDSMKND